MGTAVSRASTEPVSRCARYRLGARIPDRDGRQAGTTRQAGPPGSEDAAQPADRKESKMQIGEPQRIYEIPEPKPVPDHAPDDEPARVPERHEPVRG
jgi:hypothetical protein